MSLNAGDISRLTRLGYLQCPTWLFTVSADRFATARELWYGSLGGSLAVIRAAMVEVIVNLKLELKWGRIR